MPSPACVMRCPLMLNCVMSLTTKLFTLTHYQIRRPQPYECVGIATSAFCEIASSVLQSAVTVLTCV